MSAISSINPNNISLNPSAFPANGMWGPKVDKADGFGTGFDMEVNALKATVSEPVGKVDKGNLVQDLVMAVDEKEKMADTMRAAVLSGESNNLHQTMIASQEADVAFTLMLEMRNKVMETYQELMRMQI